MIRLKRQLHLLGESVEAMPERVVGGELRNVLRIRASAVHEDLATIAGHGPMSQMRGFVDFVEWPVAKMKEARSRLSFVPPVGAAPASFVVELHDCTGFMRGPSSWRPPIQIFVTLEPPKDPSVDPTDPWLWDVEHEPTLPVVQISIHPIGAP